MAWFFSASRDSDPEFAIGSEFGPRKGEDVQRFVGKIVTEESEPITILGWKRPKNVEDWGVESNGDGTYSPKPDVTIRINREVV
jgi:hypothetical protein